MSGVNFQNIKYEINVYDGRIIPQRLEGSVPLVESVKLSIQELAKKCLTKDSRQCVGFSENSRHCLSMLSSRTIHNITLFARACETQATAIGKTLYKEILMLFDVVKCLSELKVRAQEREKRIAALTKSIREAKETSRESLEALLKILQEVSIPELVEFIILKKEEHCYIKALTVLETAIISSSDDDVDAGFICPIKSFVEHLYTTQAEKVRDPEKLDSLFSRYGKHYPRFMDTFFENQDALVSHHLVKVQGEIDDLPRTILQAMRASSSTIQTLDLTGATTLKAGAIEKLLQVFGDLKRVMLPVLAPHITSDTLRALAALAHFEQCTFSLPATDGRKWECTYRVKEGRVVEVVMDGLSRLSNETIETLLELTTGTPHFYDTVLAAMRKEYYFLCMVLQKAGSKLHSIPQRLRGALFQIIRTSRSIVLDRLPFTEDLARSFLEMIKSCPEVKRVSIYECYSDHTHSASLQSLLQFFQEELRINQKNVFAHAMAGELYYQLDPKKAEVHYKQALDLDPENAFALGRLGRAHLKLQRVDEAVTSLKKSIQLDPHDPLILYLLGELEQNPLYVQQALRIIPGNVEQFIALIEMLTKKNSFQEAYQYVEKAALLFGKEKIVRGVDVWLEGVLGSGISEKEKCELLSCALQKERPYDLVGRVDVLPGSFEKALKFVEDHWDHLDGTGIRFLDEIVKERSHYIAESSQWFQNKKYRPNIATGGLIWGDGSHQPPADNVRHTLKELVKATKEQKSLKELNTLSSSGLMNIWKVCCYCREQIENNAELADCKPELNALISVVQELLRNAKNREAHLEARLSELKREKNRKRGILNEIFTTLRQGSFPELVRFARGFDVNNTYNTDTVYYKALRALDEHSRELNVGVRLFSSVLQRIGVTLHPNIIGELMLHYQHYPKFLCGILDGQSDIVSQILQDVHGDLGRLPQPLHNAMTAVGASIWRLRLNGCRQLQPRELFKIFPNLKECFLRDCDLTDDAIDALSTKLHKLDLSGNRRLSARCLERLHLFDELQELSLNNCSLNDQVVQLLLRLPQLGQLDLRDAKGITDAALCSPADTSPLRKINLSGCNLLTDQGLQRLASYPKLEVVTLPCVRAAHTVATFQALLQLPKLFRIDLTTRIRSGESVLWTCWIRGCMVEGAELQDTYKIFEHDNNELNVLFSYAEKIPTLYAAIMRHLVWKSYFFVSQVVQRAGHMSTISAPLFRALLEHVCISESLVLDNCPLDKATVEFIKSAMERTPNLESMSLEGCFKELYHKNNGQILIHHVKGLMHANKAEDKAKKAKRDAFYHAIIGEIQYQRELFKSAENHLREALRLDAENRFVIGRLGRLLMHLGREEEALPFFRKSTLSNDLVTQLAAASLFLKIGDLDRAMTCTGGSLYRNLPCVDAQHLLGVVFLKKKEVDKAIDHCKDVRQRFPEDTRCKEQLLEARSAQLAHILTDTSKSSDIKYNELFSVLKEMDPKDIARPILDKIKQFSVLKELNMKKEIAQSVLDKMELLSVLKELNMKEDIARPILDKVKQHPIAEAIRLLVTQFKAHDIKNSKDVEVAIFLKQVRTEVMHLQFAQPQTVRQEKEENDDMPPLRKMILGYAGNDVIAKVLEDNKKINPDSNKSNLLAHSGIVNILLQKAGGKLQSIAKPQLQAILAQADTIRVLSLKGIPVTREMLREYLQTFTRLDTLELQECSLSNGALEEIGQYRGIKRLNLSGNSALSKAGFQHLYGMKMVEELNLSCCHHLDDEVMLCLLGSDAEQAAGDVPRLPELRRLEVGGCHQITDGAIPQGASQSKLEHLDISGTAITDKVLEQFANAYERFTSYSSLKSIILPTIGDQITNRGLRYLSRLSELQNRKGFSGLQTCSFSFSLRGEEKWHCTYFLEAGEVVRIKSSNLCLINNRCLDRLLTLTKGTPSFQKRMHEHMRSDEFLIRGILLEARGQIDALPEDLREAFFENIRESALLRLDRVPFTQELVQSLRRICESTHKLQGLSIGGCISHSETRADAVQAAIVFFEDEIRKNAESDFARAALGAIYYEKGNFEGAERYLAEAIRINPDNWVALRLLAWVFSDWNRSDEALPLFENAVSRVPKDTFSQAAILVALGIAYARKNRNSDAEESYKKAIIIYSQVEGPDSWNTKKTKVRLSEVLVCQRKFDEALSIMQELYAIDRDFNQKNVRATLGEILIELGRYDEARQPLQEALEINGDDLQALVMLAELENRQKAFASCKQLCERILRLLELLRSDLVKVRAYILLCEVLVATDDFLQAKEKLKCAVEFLRTRPYEGLREHMKLHRLDTRLRQVWDALNRQGVNVREIELTFS